jgi:hypothetical protein
MSQGHIYFRVASADRILTTLSAIRLHRILSWFACIERSAEYRPARNFLTFLFQVSDIAVTARTAVVIEVSNSFSRYLDVVVPHTLTTMRMFMKKVRPVASILPMFALGFDRMNQTWIARQVVTGCLLMKNAE